MTIGTTYFADAGASRTFYPTMPLASEMTLDCFLTVVVFGIVSYLFGWWFTKG